MYALSLTITNGDATAIYSLMAAQYNLPTIASLIVSLKEDIEWQCAPDTLVHYLDNLRETSEGHAFQIRFRTQQKARELTTLYLSLEPDNQTVYQLDLSFPARGDRGCSSNLLGWLKAKVGKGACDFEIAGFSERRDYLFVREHSLSAFQWVEPLGRYLHVKDHLDETQEMRRQ